MKKKTKNKLKKIAIIAIGILISIIINNITQEYESKTKEIQTSETIKKTEEDITNENKSTNIDISNIPKYDGKMVISINNDTPYFEEKDKTTQDFEYYSNLDNQGRAGVAYANICKLTMPPKGTKRDSLSYKPTGWEQYLYGENNREHLYERCHLIAWQLGNENNNKKNLITGTAQMNSAMIEYENAVANWIKEKNKKNKDYHVLYRVTPIYKGEDQLATGVEIEAKSVEEEGVSFNKFIYNVQDNFEIDYKTGKAKLIKE